MAESSELRRKFQMLVLNDRNAEPFIRKALMHFRYETGLCKPAVLDLYSGDAAYRRFGGEAGRYLAVDAEASTRADVVTCTHPLRPEEYRARLDFAPDLVVSCFGLVPNARTQCADIAGTVAQVFPEIRGILFGSLGFVGRNVASGEMPGIGSDSIPGFNKSVFIQHTGVGRNGREEVFVWRMFTRTHG